MLWRARRNRGYLHGWGQRLGFAPVLPDGARPLWLHAVSVGETVAAAPLIHALLDRNPDIPLLVTSTTPTGADRVRALFGDRVTHCFIPFDLPDAVARFLARTRPRASIIMETEVWPNLFRACHRRSVPIVLVNARLSERSARGYRRAGRIIERSLDALACIAAQGEIDAERFRSLGVPAERVRATGNLKYEIEIAGSLRAEAASLREKLGTTPIWIAASTHEGEEAQVLDAFKTIRQHVPDLRLLLVPRHPERFNAVHRLCTDRGWQVSRRADGWPDAERADVLLGDTMGQLMLFYGVADIAFVGGSLVPVGGHNILEPIAFGCPVVIGPHTFNMDAMREAFEQAVVPVTDSESLTAAVGRLLDDEAARKALAQRGASLLVQHRGSLRQVLALVDDTLMQTPADAVDCRHHPTRRRPGECPVKDRNR